MQVLYDNFDLVICAMIKFHEPKKMVNMLVPMEVVLHAGNFLFMNELSMSMH
jgi:hypothetical protein